MNKEAEVRIKLKKVIGCATPFYQSGSWRIALPKGFVRMYGRSKPLGRPKLGKDEEELEGVFFVFIETDKGVLIKPLKELLPDFEMKDKLGFTYPSGLSLKEIAEMINKIVEEEETQ